jgi:hypothetical protein
LQASLAEAEVNTTALKQAMSDLSVRAIAPDSSHANLSLEQSRALSKVDEKLRAEEVSRALSKMEDKLRSLTECDERRLVHIEDQLQMCTRNSEREMATMRSDLLTLQESLLADKVNCSTSSLLRRVVALESDQEKASTRSAQQLCNEREVHETEARIHREETIRALREERELWEQGHMQFERRWRVEAEAQTKEKERRKEVEFALDRRISELSITVSEVRQEVRLVGMAS